MEMGKIDKRSKDNFGRNQKRINRMKLKNSAKNFLDKNGNPAGGFARDIGFSITWQKGPLGRGNNKNQPNGAFVEDVLAAVIYRLEFYQNASDGKFQCRENQLAIEKLYEAIHWLFMRTLNRQSRGVEGTHEA